MQISYNLKKCSKTTWPGVAKLKRLRLLAQGTRRRGARESGRESAASRRRPFPARTGGAAGPARGSASLRTSGSFRGSSDADRCEELRISCSMLRGLRDVHSFCIASLAAASHLLIKMRADITGRKACVMLTYPRHRLGSNEQLCLHQYSPRRSYYCAKLSEYPIICGGASDLSRRIGSSPGLVPNSLVTPIGQNLQNQRTSTCNCFKAVSKRNLEHLQHFETLNNHP